MAIFDVDETKVGSGSAVSRAPQSELHQVVEDQNRGGRARRSARAAQAVADELVEAGVKIIFNYSESLLGPPEVTVHTSSPAVDLLHALYFYLT